MIETACCFYKVVQNIHIPLGRNNSSIPFEARFKFLRDLAALNFYDASVEIVVTKI
jgi:hypothetical protein